MDRLRYQRHPHPITLKEIPPAPDRIVDPRMAPGARKAWLAFTGCPLACIPVHDENRDALVALRDAGMIRIYEWRINHPGGEAGEIATRLSATGPDLQPGDN